MIRRRYECEMCGAPVRQGRRFCGSECRETFDSPSPEEITERAAEARRMTLERMRSMGPELQVPEKWVPFLVMIVRKGLAQMEVPDELECLLQEWIERTEMGS